jgi:hypothetical protein
MVKEQYKKFLKTRLIMNRKRIIGYNFLHTHSCTEKRLGLDEKHVIVDREDYEEVIEILHNDPKIIDDYKILLEVTVDTDYSDLVTQNVYITEQELKTLIPIFNAIKEFKPYKGERSWTFYHNYPHGECCRTDLGEKNPKKLYGHIKEFNEIEFTEYLPVTEYGFHTITSVKIMYVKSEQTLL